MSAPQNLGMADSQKRSILGCVNFSTRSLFTQACTTRGDRRFLGKVMAYYLVPVGDGGEVVFAAPMVIGGLIGAGYSFTHHGDWWSGGFFVCGITLSIFSHVADWIDSLVPSAVLTEIISTILRIIGMVLMLYVGLGGFVGGFLAWLILDLFGHLNTAH